VAVGLLVAVTAGVLLWQRPWQTSKDVTTAVPDDSRALLTRQFGSLTAAASRDAFRSAAGRSRAAHEFANDVWGARRQLGVTNVRLTYEQGGAAIDRADGSTSARVKVTWRPSGGSVFAGSRPSAAMVRFRLLPRTHGFDVVGASGSGADRLPIWLAGKVGVVESGSATVLTIGGTQHCAGIPASVRTAVGAVEAVVPDVKRSLVVVCPSRDATAAALLGRHAADIAQIAAVSTPLGGSRGTPAIVLNPQVFDRMDARARQVVLSHEATHVLTGVIGKKPALWVAEGYADFVALHDDRAPLTVSAGQILAQVRASGPPKALPSNKDFDEASHGLGTVYESAWMVFRFLADQFGDAAVTGFYQDVVSGTTPEEAAQHRFGWSLAQVTGGWQAYLTKRASTAS
jgi:hypothetical protein